MNLFSQKKILYIAVTSALSHPKVQLRHKRSPYFMGKVTPQKFCHLLKLFTNQHNGLIIHLAQCGMFILLNLLAIFLSEMKRSLSPLIVHAQKTCTVTCVVCLWGNMEFHVTFSHIKTYQIDVQLKSQNTLHYQITCGTSFSQNIFLK